jgi:hypothetical protein
MDINIDQDLRIVINDKNMLTQLVSHPEAVLPGRTPWTTDHATRIADQTTSKRFMFYSSPEHNDQATFCCVLAPPPRSILG